MEKKKLQFSPTEEEKPIPWMTKEDKIMLDAMYEVREYDFFSHCFYGTRYLTQDEYEKVVEQVTEERLKQLLPDNYGKV